MQPETVNSDSAGEAEDLVDILFSVHRRLRGRLRGCWQRGIPWSVAMAMHTILFCTSKVSAEWPQAAGPNHNYQTTGHAVTEFSVSRDQHVLWRMPLPNTGESTPVIANGCLFVTCHTPMTEDAQPGRDTYGFCFDARTGQERWRRILPAVRVTDMASGFSDNTAASAVTDGQYVCFVNVGGSVSTFNLSGELIWQHRWVPFGRHHARQQEPILFEGMVIFLRTAAADLPATATTKDGAKPFGRAKEYWTKLHAFDLITGELKWVADAGTSVHSLSMLNRTADGSPCILTGRGGGHQPPEEPYGLSLLDARTGQTLRELPIAGYAAHQNAVWRGNQAAAFVGMQHQLINLNTGQVDSARSLTEEIQLRRWSDGRYVNGGDSLTGDPKRQRPTTYHTNCLVGDYHYFRTHNEFLLGRVQLSTSRLEYLQVPVQVVRNAEQETLLWDRAIENDVRNNDGFVVCQDARAKLNGWGHVSAASPIVVGDYLYMPTMTGVVYVVRWNAEKLDETALVSISDLGPAGQTWTLSSLAYSEGRLYARTLKELICLGE